MLLYGRGAARQNVFHFACAFNNFIVRLRCGFLSTHVDAGLEGSDERMKRTIGTLNER